MLAHLPPCARPNICRSMVSSLLMVTGSRRMACRCRLYSSLASPEMFQALPNTFPAFSLPPHMAYSPHEYYRHLCQRRATREAIDSSRMTSKALGHGAITSSGRYLSFLEAGYRGRHSRELAAPNDRSSEGICGARTISRRRLRPYQVDSAEASTTHHGRSVTPHVCPEGQETRCTRVASIFVLASRVG
jgi:hypothetical protein